MILPRTDGVGGPAPDYEAPRPAVWRRSRAGNLCRVYARAPGDQGWLTVFARGGFYRWCVAEVGRAPVYSPRGWRTEAAAVADVLSHLKEGR